MKLARAIGVPWYSPTLMQKSACDRAAESGNLDCLVYAHLNGARWCEFTCNYAAKDGHLNCVVYLRENGFPWVEDTCIMAVCSGLETLKYWQENGCPWDENVCDVAPRFGQIKCLRYAYSNGCPWNITNICHVPLEIKVQVV